MAHVRPRADLWDELVDADGTPRAAAAALVAQLRALEHAELQQRQDLAEIDIVTMGITFTVYSDGRGIDRAWPFDIIPRIIDAVEWRQIERGLIQRLQAINMFIDDIYHDQTIVADGVFPVELLGDSVNFRPECVGVDPKFGIWSHICGSDLVRDSDGTMYVLEDNLRVPSGVSYMLENRAISKRVFADLFMQQSILPVDSYTDELNRMLVSLAADGVTDPVIAVLTPGIFNSAYFEHSFLAQRIGAALVEGADLFVGDDDHVYMRTLGGRERVDVIYRRVDDLFLDPEVFRPDSALGVPGLMRAWRKGNVAIANAPGSGVADDKVVYAWVPDIIRYYTGAEPLLPNVPTYRCFVPDEREYVIEHIEELVVKPANESGGSGILIGDRATRSELDGHLALIESNPRNWVAQPILSLSTVPTICDGEIDARHVDLRPFILSGATSYVTAGGLTRVALREGSLIVNSSQGGGSKDTWIVENAMILLSRVADSLYWGARYLERAEDTARVIRSYTELVIDMPTHVVSSWEPLLAVAGEREAFDALHGGTDELDIVRFLVADTGNPGSVASSIASARENLRTTREVLPRDVWQAANDLSLYTVANVASGVDRRNRSRFLNHVIADCQRIDGAMATLMSRDDVYELWLLGRSLERADMTARVLGVRAAALIEAEGAGHAAESEIYDDVQWMGLLRSVNALQMYQRSTRGPIEASKAVAFLVLDPIFPRSVAACVTAIRHALGALPRGDMTLPSVDALDEILRGVPLGTALAETHDGAALDDAMDRVLLGLAAVNTAVVSTLFHREV